MLRKAIYEQRMVTGGWVSIDLVDDAIIERVYKKNIRQGEERLMLAVLENAVEHFQKYVLARKPSGEQLFREAEEWFLDKDNEPLYSFENICDTLGFHPDPIRKGLMAWKEAKLKLGSDEAQVAGRPKLAKNRIKHPSIKTFQEGIDSRVQPHLTIIAVSLWLIVFLGVTCVVFALASMWKENRFGWPLRGIIWFTPAIAGSCAIIALLARYVQTARSSEEVLHRVEASHSG